MIRFSFLIVALVRPVFPADSESGSLCIAPFLAEYDHFGAPGAICESKESLSVRIDAQHTMPWPLKTSMKIEGLDTATRHRVVVFCHGKAQQSFTFRFSDYAGGPLCLFLNDFYKTVQLAPAKQCPWCNCK